MYTKCVQDSEAAIQWAIDNAIEKGDVVHLLHVIPEPHMLHIWTGAYIPVDDDQELMEIEDTKEFVKHRFAKMLASHKVPFMLHVVVGSLDNDAIAHVITNKAKDVGAELLIMAKHSKGAFKEFWVGSVTKAVLKQCTVPVAVVPHDARSGS